MKMNIKGTIILLNVFSITLSDKLVYRKFPCSMEKNRYYHKQLNGCQPCDKCLPGEGTDLTAQVEVHETFGALNCRPCQQCKPGTYNTRRAFKCKPCKDCTSLGRTVKTACAPERKEVCGKRIKVNTTTTSEPRKIISTHNPPFRDGHPDSIVETNYRSDGHTVLNNHTHINISALAVALVIMGVAILVVLGIVVYRKCYQGNRGCSLRQTNTMGDRGDSQPFMARSGSGYNTPSVVSEIQPQTSRPVRMGDGINNTFTIANPESGDENACGVLYTERGNRTRPSDQNEDTSSDKQCVYIPLVQEELSVPRNMEESQLLSSDVEEDAGPYSTVINETSSSTGRIHVVRYTKTPAPSNTASTVPSNNIHPHDDIYHEQVALYNDNKSARKTISNRGKRTTNREELEKFAREVSKHIGPKKAYRDLGMHLNVSTTDIDIIEEEENKLAERGYRTLRKWMECQPDAGIDNLKKGICDIGRKDILFKIRSKSFSIPHNHSSV